MLRNQRQRSAVAANKEIISMSQENSETPQDAAACWPIIGNFVCVMPFCELAFDHEPGETCPHCNLEVDKYGNTEGDFRNCCFPDCGCDGERLCMAGNANEAARGCNVEGMYQRRDRVAIKARMDLLKLCSESEA